MLDEWQKKGSSEFDAPAVKALIRYCYTGYLDYSGMSEGLKKEIIKMACFYNMGDLEEYMKASLSSGRTAVRRQLIITSYYPCKPTAFRRALRTGPNK